MSAGAVEAEVIDLLLLPERQEEWPRPSRAYVRIDISLRMYWHNLFDICPALLTLSGPDGMAIYRPFMRWAAEQDLSMGWQFYLWVGQWLLQSTLRDQVTPELLDTLMAASAARWAVLDRSAAAGIVLGGVHSPAWTVGWKQRSVSGGREVERWALAEPLPLPEGHFGYFLLSGPTLADFPGWLALPR
ncbi:methanobactin biosynthesis protein MbnC [Chitinimonas lacunae]|uniref:Methanobactin biosynthesis protein MbnC n=1 Tax=Chitinimonas lacunae TaxID=1963018 RepID=A0ABV8MMP6_9NEIS